MTPRLSAVISPWTLDGGQSATRTEAQREIACPAGAAHDLRDGHVNESERASRERPVRSLDLFKLLEPYVH